MEMPKLNEFLKFNIGHVITILVMAFGWYGLWVTMGIEQRQLRQELIDLHSMVIRMDAEGTRKSQQGIEKEMEFAKSNDRRMTAMEGNWRELVPKVERMATNIEWLLRLQGADPSKPQR